MIDTFHVESAERVDDAEYTVNVRAPYAVDIKSVSWDTSPPVADKSFTLRTSEEGIREAPHVVGWPAFQRHIRDVAPEEAGAILKQVGSKLNESPS